MNEKNLNKGYVINNIGGGFQNLRYRIGIQENYIVSDEGILKFLSEPEIFLTKIFEDNNGFTNYSRYYFDGSEDYQGLDLPGLDKFEINIILGDYWKYKHHLKLLLIDKEYNKQVVEYFEELGDVDFMEDSYNGFYWEFNEY